MTAHGEPEDLPADGLPADGRTPADFADFDDTLADGPSTAAVPEAAKRWLGDQRFVHGLLRALHTADAAAREGRIAALLERIDAERAAEPRRRWFAVATAALVLACLGLWAWLPERLPTAEAAVERAVAELARDVDRRFRFEMVTTGAQARQELRQEFLLVTRPGMRFRVDGKLAFGSMQLGEFRIGCDGTELWVRPENGMFRRAAPLAESERLLNGFGDVLDLGYLDVHDLVKHLPGDFDLRVVGRERDAAGRSQLRIEAVRRNAQARVRVRSAWLLCDEATGIVTHLEAHAELGRGLTRRVRLEYLGEEPPGLVEYRRPW